MNTTPIPHTSFRSMVRVRGLISAHAAFLSVFTLSTAPTFGPPPLAPHWVCSLSSPLRFPYLNMNERLVHSIPRPLDSHLAPITSLATNALSASHRTFSSQLGSAACQSGTRVLPIYHCMRACSLLQRPLFHLAPPPTSTFPWLVHSLIYLQQAPSDDPPLMHASLCVQS